MFINCFDEKLKQELIEAGFKLISEDKEKSVFLLSNIKFNFKEVDKTKFLITKRLDFGLDAGGC